MFKKLITFDTISLAISAVLIIILCCRADFHRESIMLGYLLCDTFRLIGKFLSEWLDKDDDDDEDDEDVSIEVNK